MAINKKRNWLIAYDIADPRRLSRIHRTLSKEALAVQYSLYLYHGDSKQVRALLNELGKHMKNSEDDLRAYPIPIKAEIHTLGEHGFLDRIILTDENFDQTIRLIKHG